ncbi:MULTISPECIES: DUF4097 family beta strand repeat-containing protein [Paenibacillus]|uniref:DUF4097 family beta strand repeat-containing protein n=1 Tax=Paenibacillus TaxID=44249 RepID=UPI00048D1A7F|nr:DUF4097 family beta strand repeat-containing protein [Paenibacillus sp. IHBB 10380]
MRKIITASLVLLAVGGLAMGCRGLGTSQYNHEVSFGADRIDEIEVNNDSWDIEFKHSDSPSITIACDGKRQNNKSEPVTIDLDGNKIIVTQEDQGDGMGGFTFGKKGTITLSIPDHEVDTITLNNDAGDIQLQDVAAPRVVLTNHSGSADLEGLSADHGEFTSIDGDIQLTNSSLNELTVTTGSGGSYITNVTSPEMIIASNDGEVSIKAAEEGRLLRVETESGDIAVSYTTPPASLKLTANSGSSDISARLDGFKETRRTEQSVEGTIGDASNTLELVSQDGTISVK